MRRRSMTAAVLVAALGLPAAAHAQLSPCLPETSLPGTSAIVLVPSVTVCVNGLSYVFENIITRGPLSILPTTVTQLGNGASFTVSASFDSDPFVNFTFGSVLPVGFGPLSYDVFFSVPLAPGAYTTAASSGTLGVTAAGGNATGQVSLGSSPFYITGFGDATDLGVGTGTATCSVASPPSPNSISCNPSGASNTFAPTSYSMLSAELHYVHNTLGTDGSSTVGWTGAVSLDAVAAPEPATLGLVFGGLTLLGAFGARRRRIG